MRFATPDRRLLLLSLALQLVLGLLFGHANDMRIFMVAGYLAGTGHNPYVPHDLTAVFHHLYFNVRSSVGYPPPWPFALGLLYRASYGLVHNLLVYNLAIKLPIIAANVGLAYLVGAILQRLGTDAAACRKAWVFLLFNPFLLYFTAAWGQIDGIATLLGLVALVLLSTRRTSSSALVLALAACIKPIALPLLVAALVYLARRSLRRAIGYCAVFLGGVFLFYVAPFFVLGWSAAPALRKWNYVLTMSGTLSYMSILRVVREPFALQGRWWLVGLLWIPALAAAAIVAVRRRTDGFEDLLKTSTALALVFFLTRTWVSEANLIVLLPLVLMLTVRGALDRRALPIVWMLPLLFTLVGWTELQLLWPAFPGVMTRSLTLPAHLHHASVVGRAVLVVAWQIAGWWIVVACLRRGPARAPALAREALAP